MCTFGMEMQSEPIKAYNDFHHNWIAKGMNGSIEDYISYNKRVKETADIPADIPNKNISGRKMCQQC